MKQATKSLGQAAPRGREYCRRPVRPSVFAAAFAVLLTAATQPAWADAGVLIPTNLEQPDPKILSLEEMQIDIRIDNGVARVGLRQIFASHSDGVLEGNWVFVLPERATVSDFAVWDGVERIPGVVLERRRAEEIYESLVMQRIDPGLLQQGEHGSDEARRSAVFSARVAPIPAWGFKRVEMEYHERLVVENLRSYFAVPLRPDAYQAQRAGRLTIRLELLSSHAIEEFRQLSATYPLSVEEQTPHRVLATFDGRGVTFSEDFAISYRLDQTRADSLEVLTYRDPAAKTPNPTTLAPEAAGVEPGFFQASALLAPAPIDSVAPAGVVGPPMPARAEVDRNFLILFDNSLSMQWEKLDREFRALETMLHSLEAGDRFNLLLFNNEVESFETAPVEASFENIDRALSFVRRSLLRGGTNLRAVLETALTQLAQQDGESYLILLSDGGATRGPIHNNRLAEWYRRRLAAIDTPVRTYLFAVGDDANLPLMRLLALNDGVLEWVRSTEPIDFKLNAFISKIGRRPLDDLSLSVSPANAFDMIYPLQERSFDGSLATWVGRYWRFGQEAVFSATGSRGDEPVEMQATVALPVSDLEHSHLPRGWARARVDALLEKIEREGEDRETIDEIIRLARKYKFVTPYTSFLAAPRSLLRPRAIRPGDPVLRVETDPSIISVTAVFPFRLVKKLRRLQEEDAWQTRFLVPKDMQDGRHKVRLILRDRHGRVFREAKTFDIVSKPPVIRIHLDRKQYRRGEPVALRVAASKTTRTLVARMYGVPAVSLRWNSEARYNTGSFVIPADLPAGRYSLRVTAEDFAHNIGSQEVSIDVVP